jgi:hypothetical protein
MGVRLRRRFGFVRGQITAYEDEHLTDTHEGEQRSRILTEEIERPRVGPMRDIVATIQPEQDAIVRASLADSVCVQGAPGTGKTAVGLHRAAYLLYAHRERLARSGVLVVGPNRSFLSYIGTVLPALGELQVRQVTVDELVGSVAVRGQDSDDVALLKGDARMADVLHRAVWSQLRQPTDALVVPRGSRRWRIPGYVVDDIVSALRGRGVRYGAGRSMLPQQLAHAVLLRMEAAGIRRTIACRTLWRAPNRCGRMPTWSGQRWTPYASSCAYLQMLRRWLRRPTAYSMPKSSGCCSGRPPLAAPVPLDGRWRTRCSSMRRVTLWSERPVWVMSSWTRRRTCHRCSSVR